MQRPRRPSSRVRRSAGVVGVLGYLGAIVAANWVTTRVGTVTVGLGLLAPAGVYLIGPALVARDLVQWALGQRVAAGALACGAGLSYLVADPAVATASVAAFAVSETLDFAVFTWQAPRWARAVFAAGVVGLVTDSIVFLLLAFGSRCGCLARCWANSMGSPWRQW
jgi:uncharacterized PurR-regulated membrane protein YhhQ (DUF165 family)